MFDFESPKYFNLLFALIFLALVFTITLFWKVKKQKELGDKQLITKLLPNFSLPKTLLKFLLQVVALFFLIIALVNPRSDLQSEILKRDGIDIVFAIDVSKSMLAEDIAPNRLEKAKQIFNQIVNELQNDRIGIIAYAGSAYPVLPMTSDYSIGKMYLENITTDMLSSQGTALDQAISQAINYFDYEKASKLIILISDGEDHGDGAEDIAQTALEKGIKIVTIGLGTEQGGTIPLVVDGKKVGNKKDKNGETVITKLNPEVLTKIAEASKGAFIDGNSTKEVVAQVLDILQKIEKNEFETKQVSGFISHYHWFLALALLLLSLDVLFLNTKTAWLQKWKNTKSKP